MEKYLRSTRTTDEIARREEMIESAETNISGAGNSLREFFATSSHQPEEVVDYMLSIPPGRALYISAGWHFWKEDKEAWWAVLHTYDGFDWPRPKTKRAPYSRAFVEAWFEQHDEEVEAWEVSTNPLPSGWLPDPQQPQSIQRLHDLLQHDRDHDLLHRFRAKMWWDAVSYVSNQISVTDEPVDQLNTLLGFFRNGIPNLNLGSEELQPVIEPRAKEALRAAFTDYLIETECLDKEEFDARRMFFRQWDELFSTNVRHAVLKEAIETHRQQLGSYLAEYLRLHRVRMGEILTFVMD
ncbi:hypothetical protein F5Y16DRAFT_415186 [Xylariaceae sp. FL0255]|nr:hypothetical protein F5Y16DRAFT_415186 [Xylariaceae sp. FL0255]